MKGWGRTASRTLGTPIRAGQDGDQYWLVAVHPISDLFFNPKTHERPSNRFIDELWDIAFVEVYTDETERMYGGRCCVVDVFAYPSDLPYHERPGRVLLLKVAHKTEAMWGLMSRDPDRERKWLNKPLRELIPDSAPPIQLYRFVVDEEGFDFGSGSRSWVDHAVSVLRTSVNTLIHLKWPKAVTQTSMGILSYEGDFDFYDVAETLIERGTVF